MPVLKEYLKRKIDSLISNNSLIFFIAIIESKVKFLEVHSERGEMSDITTNAIVISVKKFSIEDKLVFAVIIQMLVEHSIIKSVFNKSKNLEGRNDFGLVKMPVL